MKKLISKLWNWAFGLFKKYPAIIIFFGLGVLFWLIQYKLQRAVGHIVPSGTTTFKLLAYFCLLVSPYLLLLKKKKFVLANLLIIGPILLLFEFVCFLILGSPDKPVINFNLPEVPEGHLALKLGSAPWLNDTMHDSKEDVFEVDYFIDEYSRRITPGYDSLREEYALFFGCSIAFGYGLKADETLPYYYQNSANVNSKNYAYTGYSSNQMLARLQLENLSEQVPEDKGVAYYIFFWDHIKRAIGTMDRYNEWVANAPYYYMLDDKLVRDASFRKGRYWTSKFYEFAYQSSIVQYFEIDFPNKIRNNHFEVVSEMIAESKREYEKQFDNDEFYLVFYPAWKNYEESELDELKTYLDKKKVKYIDLNTFMDYTQDKTLGGDPHPNAETNKELADILHQEYLKITD